MPKVSEVPEKIQPYVGLGLDLTDQGREWNCECPFCGRDKKFNVNATTGMFRCLICSEGTEKGGGNAYTFIRALWDLCAKATPIQDYKELAASRRFLDYNTLISWGVVKSTITGKWLVPGYGADGKLNQLYRYMRVEGRMALLVTPTLGHQLHGMNLYKPKRKKLYFNEGPWDGMAMWEVMRKAKFTSSGELLETSSEESSLLGDANILAAPGCNVFFPSWIPLFKDKDVYLIYDSDHPRIHPKTNQEIAPAGYQGQRRVIELIGGVANSIHQIQWGPNGYDPDRPSGFDTRDMLSL